MKAKHYFILTIIVLALPFTVQAQDDVEPFNLHKEFSIGIFNLGEDAWRYGKYSGLTDDDSYALANFKLEKRPDPNSSDTTRWRFQGWRLGLDSRRVEFDYNRQGAYRFKADYRETPNFSFNDGLIPFREQAPGIWNLAPDWNVDRNNATTRGFLNLQESLVDLSVDTQRRRLDLSYDHQLGPAWKLDIDYRHETKKGERTLGGMFGYNFYNARSVMLPAPVDFTTDILEAMVGYTNGRVQLNFGIYASFFSNHEETLVFQNPFAHQSQWATSVRFPDSQGRISLEPDNSHLLFRLNGSTQVGAGTRLTADFSYGTMKQNDPLLPYTINPELVVHTPVPRTRLDGQIDTTMFNLRLTSRAGPRLGMAVKYHYDDRDNKTPRDVYPYIGADSQDQRDLIDGRINRPYSYTRQKLDATMTYRFSRSGRLKVGVETLDYERDFQEVQDSEELVWLAGISFRGWSKASLKLDFKTSDRDVSAYTGNIPLITSSVPGTVGEDDFSNHPLLRKYFLTGRDRDEYRFRADVFPVARFNIGLSASYYKDDYDEGYFGLNEATIESWSVDAGWYPAENVSLTGFYTSEGYEAFQSNRYFFGTSAVENADNDWSAETEDSVDTYNIALAFTDIGADRGWKGVEFGLDYTYSNIRSVIDVVAVTWETEPVPDLLSRMQTFSVWGSFAVGERSSIRLTAESAELKTKDWALDGVAPDTLSTTLLLGQSAANYDLWLVSASWSYRF